MIKNKIETPSNDGEFLDSQNLQNSQLDNTNSSGTFNGEISALPGVVYGFTIDNNPLTNTPNTPNTPNTTSTNKYKVVLSTPTKIIINVNGNGASYSPIQFTKTLTIGDEVELPIQEEGN